MLKLADIFNAPSDDEDFFGFGPDVPMETGSLEDSCEIFDSLESRKMPRYPTEELREIFTEDKDSEEEAFEEFSSNEHESNGKKTVEAEDSDCENDLLSLVEAEQEEDKKDTERELSKRKSVGFRVALQFPTKKSAEISSKFCLKDNIRSPSFTQSNNNKTRKKVDTEVASSGMEEDGKEVSDENSSALLKRAMNVKENKAMLAQLLAELNSLPDLFPVKNSTPTPKQKKPPKKRFSEGQIERRTNPTRRARPPEKFALENFTASAVRFAEHLRSYRQQDLLKKRLKEGNLEVPKRRRSSKYGSCRPVEDITDEELENVAITSKDKIYDKILGSTCHQCRQKTIDTKTICRNEDCGGVRGQFCGPCLRNRYGEDVKSALLDPDWFCPPCRGICNCSYCRKQGGHCATGMLIHLAKFYGYDNVNEYLESLQKQLAEDD